MFVFTPYLVPLGAGRAARRLKESGNTHPPLVWPRWRPLNPLPKARLKFLSAEVAVC